MTRSPRFLAAVAAPALAVVLALTVSGCSSTRESGAAAVVGDRRISVAAVQEAYQDVVPLFGQDAQITQDQVLNLLILQPYLTQAAADLGRGISAQDARLAIQSSGSDDPSTFGPAGLAALRANLAYNALQTDRTAEQVQATYQRIGQELKADGVHINPRYGAGMDYTDFSIVAEQPNWLAASATPAPTPAATAPEEPSTPEATPSP